MAEFMEVMRTARRMCIEMDECEVCPLYDGFNECCLLSDGPLCHMDSDFARYEAGIMKWAAENPEVRYPTWREWSDKQFPDADDSMRTCAFISKERANCMAHDMCDDCRNQPIPADIAEKLGIKPIPVELQETLVDEYERLRDRVANLNLYLEYARKNYPAVFNALEKRFSGLPGFERVEG